MDLKGGIIAEVNVFLFLADTEKYSLVQQFVSIKIIKMVHVYVSVEIKDFPL